MVDQIVRKHFALDVPGSYKIVESPESFEVLAWSGVGFRCIIGEQEPDSDVPPDGCFLFGVGGELLSEIKSLKRQF